MGVPPGGVMTEQGTQHGVPQKIALGMTRVTEKIGVKSQCSQSDHYKRRTVTAV